MKHFKKTVSENVFKKGMSVVTTKIKNNVTCWKLCMAFPDSHNVISPNFHRFFLFSCTCTRLITQNMNTFKVSNFDLLFSQRLKQFSREPKILFLHITYVRFPLNIVTPFKALQVKDTGFIGLRVPAHSSPKELCLKTLYPIH